MVLRVTESRVKGQKGGLLLHNKEHTVVYKTTNDNEIAGLLRVLQGVLPGFVTARYVHRKLDISARVTAAAW